MNKGIRAAIIVGAAGLLGTVAGYLGGAAEESRGASTDSASMRPSKTTRMHAQSGGASRKRPNPSTVDPEFVSWMRSATEDEMRMMVLNLVQHNSGRLNFRASTMLRDLLRRNPQDTFNYFRTHQPDGSLLLDGVLQVWSSFAPRESTEALVRHVTFHRNANLPFAVRTCFEALARKDLPAAMELAEQNSRTGRWKDEVYRGLLLGCAETSPTDVDHILSIVDKLGVNISATVGRWAEVDPERAIAWVREHQPSALGYLAQGIGANDPRQGLVLYRDAFAGVRNGSVPCSLLSQWMETDYDAGVAWLEANVDAAERDVILSGALNSLTHTRPEIVLDRLIAGNPVATTHATLRSAIRSLVRRGTDDDVYALLERAPEEQQDEIRDALMEVGFIEANDDYLTGVLAAIDGKSRIGRYSSVHTALLRDPERLPEMLALVPAEHHAKFLSAFSSDLADQDPAFLDIVSQMDDPDIFAERGPQHGIAELALSQPKQAMTAVEAIPTGTGRAVAVETLVSNLMPDAPDTVLDWLETQRGSGIPDERYRKLLSGFHYSKSHPILAERIEAMLKRAKDSEAK